MDMLLVDINVNNGLYEFVSEADVDEIPQSFEVVTPYIEDVNSLEELEDALLEEESEVILFRSNADIRNLVAKVMIDFAESGDKEDAKYVLCTEDESLITGSYIVGETILHVIHDVSELEGLFNGLTSYECSEELENGIKISEESEGYYNAMKNGYNAYITGVYPQGISTSLAKHVYAEKSVVPEDLSTILDLNGALMVESENVDISGNRNFNHIHRISENSVKFDDSSYEVKRKCVSYKEYVDLRDNNAIESDYTYVLRILNNDDLNAFAKDLDRYRNEGKVDVTKVLIADECRWTSSCSLKRLLRYNMTRDGIKPCITSDVILAENGETQFDMLVKANKLADQTIAKRKCVNCPMSAKCAKCSCIPVGITEDDYCEFIKKYADIMEDYLIKLRITSALSEISTIFGQEREINISSRTRGLEFNGTNAESKPTRFSYIFEKDGRYYGLQMKQWNIVHLDPKYVFLIEAWERGLENMSTTEIEMSLKYGMSEELAKVMVNEGYAKLRQGGMI
ncbi:hypothetical protein [Butyrivibrio sp. YAB3001]|uniref:hypothetical protein n=1 Tax=Butyrivibrio sp. YAB3001 TaxID=1520812 RepID=UPI0008F6211D|nr:hypothetical protein [Butyrivibrio sp. YAB3001]SFC02308.1 hypothetical protein SAMN02910398_01346 [Butyrivibrio sp. YAB3001]